VKGWTIALGLLGGPTLFLGQLGLAYASVPWACGTQAHWVLHVEATCALAIALLLTALAAGNWRKLRERGGTNALDIRASSTDTFLSLAGMLLSAFCALAIAAQWLTQLILSPCAL
jgi:hypothetical protein